MKLSSTPKPVRIRISLGGIEHTTLESLKENITPEILDFTDGRLQRWLKQQGEESLSKDIDEIKKSNKKDESKLLDIYNTLFKKGHTQLLYYVDDWREDNKASTLLKYYLSNCESNENALTKIMEKYFGILSLREWYELVSVDIFCKEFADGADIENIEHRTKLLNDLKDAGFIDDEIEKIKKELGFPKGRIIFKETSDAKLQKVLKDWTEIKYIKNTRNAAQETSDIEKEVKRYIGNCCKAFTSEKEVWNDKGSLYNLTDFSDAARYIKSVLKKDDYEYLKDEVRCAIVLAKKYQCNYNISAESMGEYKEISEDCKFKKEISSIRSATEAYLTKIINYILFEKFKQ